ncbi:MAG: ABC transporter permease, partial [Vicinamibacterales bacterium]
MQNLMQDVRYAVRKLAASPGFAVLTIVTLALGIGANTAMFSVLNGVILRPLAYPAPNQLMFITSQFPGLGFNQFWVSSPEFLEFRDWNRAFSSVGAYSVRAANLGAERPSRPVTTLVTSELMPTLGVQPRLGRTFTLADTLPGAEDVAILSDTLWRTSFGADPAVLGKAPLIDGQPTRVVGIMPPGYDVHGQKVELWLPLTLDPNAPGNRGGHFLYLVGRLRPEMSQAAARADLERLLAGWGDQAKAQHAPNPVGHRLRIDNLQDDMVGTVSRALWVLQGAVAFVLLIACANLANLLLARADSRRREFAVRAALGASRMRMVRQFVTEGVVIALLGGALGVGFASVGLRALLTAYPDSVPRSADIALDWRVLAFTLVAAVATGLIFGLAPLLHLREQAVDSALNEGGARTTVGTARAR